MHQNLTYTTVVYATKSKFLSNSTFYLLFVIDLYIIFDTETKGLCNMRFKGKHQTDNSTLNLHEGHRERIRQRLLETKFIDADDYQVL